jgi:spermidine synthase
MDAQFEIVAWEDTKLGVLCLRRRRQKQRPDLVITEITIDEAFLMSSHLTLSERTLATKALALHAGRQGTKDLRVLVGGLGLGYTAHAALASDRVAHVEVIEFVPEVIGWMRRGLVPLSAELNEDPRLTITEDDVYARLMGPPTQQYDLILIDVDHSPADSLAEANQSFYTDAGLRRARDHLAPGGILGVWSYAEHSPFEAALRRVFSDSPSSVEVEPVTVMNDLIDEEQTDWLFFARERELP